MQEYNTADPFLNEYALGVLVKVNQPRSKGFCRPGDVLTVTVVLNEIVSEEFDFSAKIEVEGKTIMRDSFQSMNIQSNVFAARFVATKEIRAYNLPLKSALC